MNNILFALFGLTFITLSFQNCSDTKFKEDQQLSTSQILTVTDAPVTPESIKDCVFNDQVVKYGASISAFSSSSVPFNEVCLQEQRTCMGNGVLSGSFLYPTCQPGQPKDCQLDGKIVKHGLTGFFYTSKQVAANGVCLQIARTCDNGVLSGDQKAIYASCSVSEPVSLNKLVCKRRQGNLSEPPSYLAPGYLPNGGVGIKSDIYESYSDGSFKLVEKCLDWQSDVQSALNCAKEISGDYQYNFGVVLKPAICCPVGRVAINGMCQKVSGQGGYCYADTQCEAGLYCLKNSDDTTKSKCVPK